MKETEVFEMPGINSYYKVIVIRIDTFESEIVDERHFPDVTEAMRFCDSVKDMELSTFVVRM